MHSISRRQKLMPEVRLVTITLMTSKIRVTAKGALERVVEMFYRTNVPRGKIDGQTIRVLPNICN